MLTQSFQSELRKCIHELGISEGSDILVHSDAIITSEYEGSIDEKLSALFDTLTDISSCDGSVCSPSFSMSFTKGEDYNLKDSPGTTGIASEYFRKMPNITRTLDPIYNVCLSGPLAAEHVSKRVKSCFGDDTVFDSLYESNASLLFLGCSLDRATFVHYVEQKIGVSYRYFKKFSGKIVCENNEFDCDVELYVRNLSLNTIPHHERLRNYLAEKKVLKISTVGRFRCMSVSARDFFDCAADLLAVDQYALIGQGAK